MSEVRVRLRWPCPMCGRHPSSHSLHRHWCCYDRKEVANDLLPDEVVCQEGPVQYYFVTPDAGIPCDVYGNPVYTKKSQFRKRYLKSWQISRNAWLDRVK